MLDQIEADLLISENKFFEDNSHIFITGSKSKIQKTIKGKNSNEEFILNIERGRIDLSKVKYQTRHKRTNSILLRIDTSGPRHQNPDGTFVACPHIHIYKEGAGFLGDKWAYSLDPKYFSDVHNFCQLLKDFLIYFNVEQIPAIISEERLI